jgi:hypothetical protein
MSEVLEKRIGRAWMVPNQYHGFPEPLLITLESEHRPPGWTYTRSLCPVNGCKYDGLPQDSINTTHICTTHLSGGRGPSV